MKTSFEIENGIRTFCSEKQKSQIIYHQQTCTNGYINDEFQAEGKCSQMATQRCNKKWQKGEIYVKISVCILGNTIIIMWHLNDKRMKSTDIISRWRRVNVIMFIKVLLLFKMSQKCMWKCSG